MLHVIVQVFQSNMCGISLLSPSDLRNMVSNAVYNRHESNILDSYSLVILYILIIFPDKMGISRDHWHKRRATGGKRNPIRKKRKFEMARPAAMTKLGAQRIHPVRVRGGNKKFRALRLDQGSEFLIDKH